MMNPINYFLTIILAILVPSCLGAGILYPQESESREVKTLDGIWDFRIAPRNEPNRGFQEEWFKQRLRDTGEVLDMPVPSSYNDITQDKTIRDHVGWAWYDRTFWIPDSWFSNKQRVFLRFGGVNYHAKVWINGIEVVEHSGGHLPFNVEVPPLTFYPDQENWITVAVNNTLTPETVPQGRVIYSNATRFPAGYFTLSYNFDFFNYAGIHRTVHLYTTPRNYISDITTSTDSTGHVNYSISVITTETFDKRARIISGIVVTIEDKDGNTAASSSGGTGQLVVPNPSLWWPFTMKRDSEVAYLYTLVVTLQDNSLNPVDTYRLKIGLRSVTWNSTSFLINGEPFYFRGFGRHEDFNIRGRGIDPVMLVKDHNLLKWTGANSYRTSHYPYCEEIMDLTDRLGIVIIDEVPAVALDTFGPTLLENHKTMMRELIQRDKNRPSVVMWSVGNEPQSQRPEAEPYFKEIVQLTKTLDPLRPVTLVTNQGWSNDYTVKFLDIICINRYYSWYSDAGHTEIILKSMELDALAWINKFKKPLIVAEYGADTVAGLHMSPEFVFTEEYQVQFMREHFKAFDFLRRNTSFIGEMIWNFADFMTAQGITRVTGNRKGVFTRDRNPKSSAHVLRSRYYHLAKELDGYPLPSGLQSELPVYS